MSSPQTQDLIKSNATNARSPADGHAMASPSSHHSPQPELATMTNVNVLDLHKEYVPEKGAGSIQYIYSAEMKANDVTVGDSNKIEDEPLVNSAIEQRDTSAGHAIECPNEVARTSPIVNSGIHVDQLFEKMGLSDEQILRLITTNGENVQIISREIVNGEPHILTRTENGEHVLTRIVTAEPKLAPGESVIYTSVANESVDAHQEPEQIYTAAPNHITTSVLQYGDGGQIKNGLHPSYVPVTTVTGSVITTTSSGGTVDKEEDIYPDDKVPIYTSSASDLMYEDGGCKTVIYTTTSDPNELNLINGEGPVIVQGGTVQYTTANGQTVFVVTDPPLDADIHSR